MADQYRWNQEDARAATEAGYMPLEEYLRLCEENCWHPKTDNSAPLLAIERTSRLRYE
jgi:hypothetical protein